MFAMTPENTSDVLVNGEQSGGRFAIIEARVRRGSEPPRHVHSREDEFIYVLEGRLTVDVDGSKRDCPDGTWMYFPRGAEHGYTVETEEARVLALLSPAGLEAWTGNDLVCDELEQIELFVVTAARFGVTITGPVRPP